MVCEELPRVPFIPAVVKLARRRPDVHACGIGVVRAHRIPQDGEPRILLWEASVKASPPLPTVRRAVHGRVVLHIHDRWIPRIADKLVRTRFRHIVNEDGVFGILPDAAVHRPPRRSAIVRPEDTRGGDRDEHPFRIAGIWEYRMEAQPAAPRLPVFPIRPVVEAVHGPPRLPAIVAVKQSGWFDAHVQVVVCPVLDLPDPRDADPGFLREPRALLPMDPLPAEILRAHHGRAPMLARHARVDRLPVSRVQNRVANGLPLKVWAPRMPPLSIPGVEEEQALPRPHQHDRLALLHVDHGQPPATDGRMCTTSPSRNRTASGARCATESSFTNTSTYLRIFPWSSRSRYPSPGNRALSCVTASASVAARSSIQSFPSEYSRSARGR